jgi:DNA replication licensing factor MCM3
VELVYAIYTLLLGVLRYHCFPTQNGKREKSREEGARDTLSYALSQISLFSLPATMLDELTLNDEVHKDRVRIFREFLSNSNPPHYNYADNVLRMLRNEETRLIVNLDDLRSYNRDFATGLLRQPNDFFPAFNEALSGYVEHVRDQEKHHIAGKEFKIGLSGSFGDHHLNPRSTKACHLGRMISLDGIVTRCSLVRPKMLRSVHYCAKTQLHHYRDYRDETMPSNLPPTTTMIPTTDDDGNDVTMEFGLSTFRDHQRVSIQEMPERAPPGQLPRSIDVILDDDLVDKCKPGDRVQIVGVYRSVGGGGSGTFK